jgi:hypothetical protein
MSLVGLEKDLNRDSSLIHMHREETRRSMETLVFLTGQLKESASEVFEGWSKA